jgi:hypothetical protein
VEPGFAILVSGAAPKAATIRWNEPFQVKFLCADVKYVYIYILYNVYKENELLGFLMLSLHAFQSFQLRKVQKFSIH